MIHCKFVDRTFYNPANGYTVASYHTKEELPVEVARQNREAPGTFQAYGIEPPTGENLEAELDGEWKKGKYGFQLDVSYFHVDIPQTAAGIEAYFASDMIKGIGPVTAHRIVEKFGKRALYMLDHTPEKLLDIPGISETKLEEILDGYQKSTALRELMIYLQNQTRLIYDETFQFYAASKPEDAAEIIQKIYVKYWREHGKRTEDIQVLSPLRKNTEAGSNALNERLQKAVNPKRRGRPEIRNGNNLFRVGDIVMQTENKDEISNRDLGEVLDIYRQDKKMAMQVDFGDDRVVEFKDDDYWPLTLGYAMSVHKSQGNECCKSDPE